MKSLKLMITVVALMGMLALGSSLTAKTAFAQEDQTAAPATPSGPGQPAENPGSRARTDAGFDNWMRSNPGQAAQIRQNPSLLNDPNYLASHPDLQTYMNNHPDFQKAVAKNPDRVMRKTYNNQQEAKAAHQAHRKATASPTPHHN